MKKIILCLFLALSIAVGTLCISSCGDDDKESGQSSNSSLNTDSSVTQEEIDNIFSNIFGNNDSYEFPEDEFE